MRRPVMAALLAATAAATAGCGSGAALIASVLPDYSCEDITVPGHTLTDGRLASELSAAGQRTVLQTEGVTRANLATWRIVEDSAARVTIIRPLAQPEIDGKRVVASHQYVDRTPARKSDPARPSWMVSIPLTCALREMPPTPAPAADRTAPDRVAPPAGAVPKQSGAATPRRSKVAPAARTPAAKAKATPPKVAPGSERPDAEAPKLEPKIALPAPRA